MSGSDTEHTNTRRSKRKRSDTTTTKSTRRSQRSTAKRDYADTDTIDVSESQPHSDADIADESNTHNGDAMHSNTATEQQHSDSIQRKQHKNKSTTADADLALLTDSKSYDAFSTELKTHNSAGSNDVAAETTDSVPVLPKAKRKLPTFSAGSYTEASAVDSSAAQPTPSTVKTETAAEAVTKPATQPSKRKSSRAVKAEPPADDDVILIDSNSSDIEPPAQPSKPAKSTKKAAKPVKTEDEQQSDAESVPDTKAAKKSKAAGTKGKRKKTYEFSRSEIQDAFAVIDQAKQGFIVCIYTCCTVLMTYPTQQKLSC